MIVNNLNILRASIGPPENHAPLLIYSDAVTALKISGQRLKAIPRRGPQVVERYSRVD
jgi:hypothetical protein